MPRVGALVRHGRTGRGGHLIMTDRIDAAVIRSIRRHLLRIKGIEEIALRATTLQARAFTLMTQMSNRVDTYARLQRQCERFNRYVAELLIVRDYDVLKDVAPVKIAYMQLQMAAHHVVLQSEFPKYAKAFQRLAEKTGQGWWRSPETMPAIPLFQELHGLSPETLQVAHKMVNETIDFNQIKNFSPELNRVVRDGKKTGSFAELFELHQTFYANTMHDIFFRGQGMAGIGGKSLDEWFDEMILLAKEVDLELAANP